MSRFNITKGAEHRPHATILTGRSGIGKTHLCSTIPNRFFICVEQGLKGASPDHVAELARFDTQPRSFGELLEMIAAYREMAKSQGLRHLCLDSLSGIEKLVNLQACRQESVAHMEAKEFKKVWSAAMPLWQRVQNELDRVRDEAGSHLWIIAHSQETSETTTTGDMFTKWDLSFQGSGKSLGEIRQLWRAWADHVLFIDWDADIVEGKLMQRKAVGRYRSRILRTRETPNHYAKNRAGLPPTLPATWVDLARAMASAAPASEPRLRQQITAALDQLGTDDRAAVEVEFNAAKTVTALAATLSRAQGMVSAARLEEEDNETPATLPADPDQPTGEPETFSASAHEPEPAPPAPMPTEDIVAAAAEILGAVESPVAGFIKRFGACRTKQEIAKVCGDVAKAANVSSADMTDLRAAKVAAEQRINGAPAQNSAG